MNLFENSEEILDLYQTLNEIRNRFEERSVMRAVSLGTQTVGRMENLFKGQPPVVLVH